MWYLILPPLLFLGSLWLLLVFLSRRVTDPAVQDRLAADTSTPDRRIFFIKEETGLRILEKINQRFKIFFLKLHNASGSFSQSLRARREHFRELKKKASQEMTAGTIVHQAKQKKPPFWMRFRRDADSDNAVGEASSGSFLSESEEGAGTREETVMPVAEEDISPRAHSGDSVSNGATGILSRIRRREPRERHKRLFSEEDLIGKIAKNPKDAVAYEELGDYYMETKQLEDAKACYRQVIKLLPMNREVKEKVRKLERLLTRAGR